MQLFTLPITSILKQYIPARPVAETAVEASVAVAAAIAAAGAAVAATEDVDDWLGLGKIDYADD